MALRKLIRNIASNWVGYGVQIIVAFLLTPYILHSIGQTRYGIWTLSMGLSGYYGLLDLGFSAGITQYLTRYLAAKDADGLNRTASTGFVALSCSGVLVFIGSIAIAFNARSFFEIPDGLNSEVAWVIVVTGVSVALQFAFFTYSAVFTAVQRFDLANAIGIATRLLSAVAVMLCLKMGYGLIGLSVVLAATNLVDYLLRWRIARVLLPSMQISLKMPSRKNVTEIMTFGVWNFAIAGSVRLISYTDSIVIAAFMPVSAVMPFAVAANLRSYFDEVFVRVGYVFFPAVTELDAEGNRDGLRTLYLVSSKFMFLGSILCGLIAMLWARDFFRLWIGKEYAEPSGYPIVNIVFVLLLVGSMVSVGQRIGYQVLQGMRQVRLLAVLFVIEGIGNLILSIAWVRHHGLLGVALGTLVPAVIVQGVLQPLFVCRALAISLNAYCRQVLMRPVLALVMLSPLFSTTIWPDRPSNWQTLTLWGAMSFGIATAIVLLVGLNQSERNVVLMRPTGIVLKKLRTLSISRRKIEPEPAKK